MKPKEKERLVSDWFVEGIHNGARHMIVIESAENELAPIYVFPEQSLEEEVFKFSVDIYYSIQVVMDLLQEMTNQVNAFAAPKYRLVSKIIS